MRNPSRSGRREAQRQRHVEWGQRVRPRYPGDSGRAGRARRRNPRRSALSQPRAHPEFDLYLSFTGGPVLDELRSRWGTRRTAPLLPDSPGRTESWPAGCDGRMQIGIDRAIAYAPDRQASLERLLVQPARERPQDCFFVVGSLYPREIAWRRSPPCGTRRSDRRPVVVHARARADRLSPGDGLAGDQSAGQAGRSLSPG